MGAARPDYGLGEAFLLNILTLVFQFHTVVTVFFYETRNASQTEKNELPNRSRDEHVSVRQNRPNRHLGGLAYFFPNLKHTRKEGLK